MEPIDKQIADIINPVEPNDFSDSKVYSTYQLEHCTVVSINDRGYITDSVGPNDNAWFLLEWLLWDVVSYVEVNGKREMVSRRLSMATDGEVWYYVIWDSINCRYRVTRLRSPHKPPPKKIVQKYIKRAVADFEHPLK